MLAHRMQQAASGLLVPAAYAGIVLADSPIGYWRLEEAAGASSFASIGSDTTAAVPSGSLTAGVSGLITQGKAVAFTGGYLGAATSLVANSSFLALETSLRFDAAGPYGNQVLISKGYDGTDYSLAITVASSYLAAQVVYTSPSTAQLNAVSTIAPVQNGKYHVACEWDPGVSLSLWVNGALAASTDATGKTGMRPNTAFYISRSSHTPADRTIDEVAAYDHSLGTTRWAAHYNAGI